MQGRTTDTHFRERTEGAILKVLMEHPEGLTNAQLRKKVAEEVGHMGSSKMYGILNRLASLDVAVGHDRPYADGQDWKGKLWKAKGEFALLEGGGWTKPERPREVNVHIFEERHEEQELQAEDVDEENSAEGPEEDFASYLEEGIEQLQSIEEELLRSRKLASLTSALLNVLGIPQRDLLEERIELGIRHAERFQEKVNALQMLRR